jgi:hypothetical protein
MAIPSVMVVLSLILRPAVSRWTNIIVGCLVTVGPLLTMPGAWYYYIFLGVVETALTVLIVRFAWKWPRQITA